MSNWAVLLAALAISSAAVLCAEPLALNEATPPGACRTPDDCGFQRSGFHYVSFDKVITRREVCVPAKWLLGVAHRGDRVETVAKRLHRSGWIHVKAKRDGKGWILSAGSRREDFKWIEVTFDARGWVKCVAEGSLTV